MAQAIDDYNLSVYKMMNAFRRKSELVYWAITSSSRIMAERKSEKEGESRQKVFKVTHSNGGIINSQAL